MKITHHVALSFHPIFNLFFGAILDFGVGLRVGFIALRYHSNSLKTIAQSASFIRHSSIVTRHS